MSRLHKLIKKMVEMQSPRVQCCMCAVSVLSAMFGMFMLSAGVCLLLNYNFLNVDTSTVSGDAAQGKKVVGIVLTCVGVLALGVSGLVSILSFTACSRSSPSQSTTDSSLQPGAQSQGRQYHSNGTTPVRPSSNSNGTRRAASSSGATPNGRRVSDPRNRVPIPLVKDGAGHNRNLLQPRNASTPPGAARSHRHGKKYRHGQGRFTTSLPAHPEEAGADSSALTVSHRSDPSSHRLAFPGRTGHVNQGAELEEDVMSRGDLTASGSAESSADVRVVIKVDSSYLQEGSGGSPSHLSYAAAACVVSEDTCGVNDTIDRQAIATCGFNDTIDRQAIDTCGFNDTIDRQAIDTCGFNDTIDRQAIDTCGFNDTIDRQAIDTCGGADTLDRHDVETGERNSGSGPVTDVSKADDDEDRHRVIIERF